MFVLVVEDEVTLGDGLGRSLRASGYDVAWAQSLTEARTLLPQRDPDLITLDVMLPEGEHAGFTLAQEIREVSAVPILFLTARDAVEDRIHGLDLGGDDYLVKPFSLDEYLARVRALLRRDAQVKKAKLVCGPLELDLARRSAHWQGDLLQLSEREFALLELFAMNPERLYAPAELLDKLFPNADSGLKVIRVYVHYLRQKLSKDAIVTVQGGYRLGLSVAEAEAVS
ncbi:MAG: response regulator transcription factor [Deinococcota bacterium]